MVCQRCISTVEDILKDLEIPFNKVNLGEVELSDSLSFAQGEQLERKLRTVGFELVESRLNQLVNSVKTRTLKFLNQEEKGEEKLSTFITKEIHYDYSYLSNLFSSVEGRTIEQYFIHLRIEKVKELLVYDELSISEVAHQTGFSSVHHLSSQFKKVTGLTPGYFKKVGRAKRQKIDGV